MALVAVLGFVLSGCDPPSWYSASTAGGGKVKPRKLSVSATFTGTETFQPGATFTPQPGGTVIVQNNVVKGTFSGTLPVKVNVSVPRPKKRAAAAAGAFKSVSVKSVSGSFVAKTNGTLTPAGGTGQFSGVMVMRFIPASIGDACLTFSLTSSGNGTSETGSFDLAGGTKIAARSRFSGTFTKTNQATGVPSALNVSGTITGAGKIGKPARPLSADCQSLVSQL